MEEDNDGRVDVCCLCAAHSSQLGRVNGHNTDWRMIYTTTIRSEWSHLCRIKSKWPSDVFCKERNDIWEMVTKTERVAFSLGLGKTELFFKFLFKRITHIPISESFFLKSDLSDTHLHVRDGPSATAQKTTWSHTHTPHWCFRHARMRKCVHTYAARSHGV